MWLIKIESGWTNKQKGKREAEEFFKSSYKAIYKHLKSKGEIKGKGKGLYKRDDQGDYWWELRDCDYYEEFEKEKIIYSEIVRSPQFHFDTENFYIEATVFLMTGKFVKYICGLLNSNPVTFFFKQWYAGGGLGEEGYRYKKAFVENLPIPPINSKNLFLIHKIESLVDQILTAKKQSPLYPFNKGELPNADTSALERQIDELVYKLYGLTDDEIAIVEGKG